MAGQHLARNKDAADVCADDSLGRSASVKAFEGASHTGILTDDRLIDEVIQIVKGSKSGTWTDLNTKLRRKWGWLQRLVGAGLFRGRDQLMSIR